MTAPPARPAERERFGWEEVPLRPESPLLHRRPLSLYPQDRLYQEMAFLAYYLHWPRRELMELEHGERRRWCREVSAINKKLSGDEQKRIEFK